MVTTETCPPWIYGFASRIPARVRRQNFDGSDDKQNQPLMLERHGNAAAEKNRGDIKPFAADACCGRLGGSWRAQGHLAFARRRSGFGAKSLHQRARQAEDVNFWRVVLLVPEPRIFAGRASE